MYGPPPLPPTARLLAAGSTAPATVSVLPATGLADLSGTAVAGLVLLLLGLTLLRARSRGTALRWLVRALVTVAIAGYAGLRIASGTVTGGWDLAGLAVAVFTLSYASIAVGQLLPAPRVRVSPAS